MLKLSKQNYFCVCFFDKSKSYSWLSKDRVYRFDVQNENEFRSSDAKLMAGFKEAVIYLKNIKTTDSVYKNPPRKTKQEKYRKILFNVIVPPARLPTPPFVSYACNCTVDDKFPCAPSTGCLNEITAYECSDKCPAGPFCQNKRFQKRAYAKVEVRETGNKGFGLFALEDILPDQFIIEYVGEIINMDELNSRYKEMVKANSPAYYFIWISKTLVIDAARKGNDARFINHSCEPNCTPQKWSVNGDTRIGFFACQKIPAV